MIRLAIIEDSATVRALLIECMNSIPGVSLVFEADDLESAFAALAVDPVDVLISDIHLGESESLQMIRTVKQLNSDMKIFIFSGTCDDATRGAYEEAGADAFFSKATDLEALCEMLEMLVAN